MSKRITEDSLPRAIGRSSFGVHQLERRPPQQQPGYEIKLAADDETVTTSTTFTFLVPAGLHGKMLSEATAFLTTVGSGVTTVAINNLTAVLNMLSTAITIDASEFSSYTAATPAVIHAPPNSVVSKGDRIKITVSGVGSGAKGLGVILEFV